MKSEFLEAPVAMREQVGRVLWSKVGLCGAKWEIEIHGMDSVDSNLCS